VAGDGVGDEEEAEGGEDDDLLSLNIRNKNTDNLHPQRNLTLLTLLSSYLALHVARKLKSNVHKYPGLFLAQGGEVLHPPCMFYISL
jgi:hypothetical protein